MDEKNEALEALSRLEGDAKRGHDRGMQGTAALQEILRDCATIRRSLEQLEGTLIEAAFKAGMTMFLTENRLIPIGEDASLFTMALESAWQKYRAGASTGEAHG